MTERLPRNYLPTNYDLFIHIVEQQESFDASVTITYQKTNEDSKTYLNKYSNITIKSITQNGIPLKYDSDYELLTIYRSTDPDQDISSYPITINYLLHPIKYNTNGFYEYSDNCYFTKFEPNYAQMLLPCFDEPCVRSTFSVKIRIPSNLVGISNMPVETSTIIENETEIKFLPTPPMCTYLLAIFVGDFGFIEGLTKSGTPVRMHAEKSRENILEKHLKVAIFALEWMEEKMGVKYELPILQLLSHPGIS